MIAITHSNSITVMPRRPCHFGISIQTIRPPSLQILTPQFDLFRFAQTRHPCHYRLSRVCTMIGIAWFKISEIELARESGSTSVVHKIRQRFSPTGVTCIEALWCVGRPWTDAYATRRNESSTETINSCTTQPVAKRTWRRPGSRVTSVQKPGKSRSTAPTSRTAAQTNSALAPISISRIMVAIIRNKSVPEFQIIKHSCRLRATWRRLDTARGKNYHDATLITTRSQ